MFLYPVILVCHMVRSKFLGVSQNGSILPTAILGRITVSSPETPSTAISHKLRVRAWCEFFIAPSGYLSKLLICLEKK